MSINRGGAKVKSNELYGIIEGILFAMGDSVLSDRLCEVLDIDEETLTSLMDDMIEKYNSDSSRGVTIIRLDKSYQMCTKTELYEYIRVMSEKKSRNNLSNAALEVLSIVAYNQPVTRSSIEFIRGVNSDGSLSKLIELGLVEEVGRLDAPGRPVLFGTTEEFLRCFALSSLDDLPKVEKNSDTHDTDSDSTDENNLNYELLPKDEKSDETDDEINIEAM